MLGQLIRTVQTAAGIPLTQRPQAPKVTRVPWVDRVVRVPKAARATKVVRAPKLTRMLRIAPVPEVTRMLKVARALEVTEGLRVLPRLTVRPEHRSCLMAWCQHAGLRCRVTASQQPAVTVRR